MSYALGTGNPLGVTGSAQFHLVASSFGGTVVFSESTPVDRILQLRAEKLSVAKIAHLTGSTTAVVRRIVGKLDQVARRKRQEAAARRINAEDLSWGEKAARWKAETGQSEATLWRVLNRLTS